MGQPGPRRVRHLDVPPYRGTGRTGGGANLERHPAAVPRSREGLLARGYRPWPLRTVLDYNRTGQPIPPKTFVVTFDDGYASVYHGAYPVLHEYNIPATLFLATAYLDSNAAFPFDDWTAVGSKDVAAESWRPLSASQCAEMLAGGLIELGSHTHTHAVFRGRPEALYQDLLVSLEVLRARFDRADATFAFPFGIAGPALSATAKRAGLLCSLTTDKVLVRPRSDPFNWGRFNVDDADSAATLAAKLDGWFSLAQQHLAAPAAERTRNVPFAPPCCRYGGRAMKPPSPALPDQQQAVQVPSQTEVGAAGSTSSALASPAGPAAWKGFLSIVDQGVVSGTNFVTSVLIGRMCSQEEFGVYSLALSVVLILRGVQGELVNTPYMIYCYRRQGQALASYTGSTLVHHLVLTVAAVACLCGLAGLLSLGVGPAGLGRAAWMLVGAMPFLLLRHYLRQLTLSHLRLGVVLAIDFGVALLQLGGLVLLWQLRMLTVVSVLGVMGGACAVVCLAWFLLRTQPFRFEPRQFGADWRQNWAFSRWTLPCFLMGSTAPVLMPWALAITHGAADTGMLAACQTLVNVASTYAAGVVNYLSPAAAAAFARFGLPALRRLLWRTAALYVVTLGAFCLGLYLTGDLATTLVYGHRYAGTGTVLTLLALSLLVDSLGITAGNGLWAMERPQANFVADLCTFVVMIALVLWLVPPLGVTVRPSPPLAAMPWGRS